MSNISFFFPKKMQGLAPGLNAGLGNAGVTTMQIVIPLAMAFGVFGGAPMILETTSGTLIGKIPAGSETWIQNAGFVWLVLLIPLEKKGTLPFFWVSATGNWVGKEVRAFFKVIA